MKCNSDLAENLLNAKKNDILLLENNYNSKIMFNFNSQYSLHDPIIDIENNEKLAQIENETNKTKKNINNGEKKIKINKKKTKPKISKLKKSKINQDNDKNDDNLTNLKEDKLEEKTGWWS